MLHLLASQLLPLAEQMNPGIRMRRVPVGHHWRAGPEMGAQAVKQISGRKKELVLGRILCCWHDEGLPVL